MEVQMITLTQHLPNWIDGFEPQRWQFESLDGLLEMPFIKEIISECKKREYHKFSFLLNGSTVFMSFQGHMEAGDDIGDYVFPIGKVNNIEEAKKLFRNDQVHI